MALFASTVET